MHDSYFKQVVEDALNRAKRKKIGYIFTVAQKEYLLSINPKLKITRSACYRSDKNGNYIYEVRA